jgi:hypothetical protein
MSVMLTKFESKSNRVKGVCFHARLTLLDPDGACKGLRSIQASRSSLPVSTMEQSSCGTIAWVFSSTGSKNTKARSASLRAFASSDSRSQVPSGVLRSIRRVRSW